MTLQEYIENAKKELDDMQLMWLENHGFDPDNWPLENEEGEWGEQELAQRFS